MSWFFLGLLILATGLAIAELLVRVSPRRLLTVLRWLGILAIIAAIMLLAIGVRNLSLAALIGMALALWARAGMFAPKRPFSQGHPHQSSAHKSSQVETASLRMLLDHESGELDGEILSGPLAGQKLSALSRDQLAQFHTQCLAEDQDAVPLLEAYLDRAYGTDWRSDFGGGSSTDTGGGAEGAMSKSAALDILGLTDGASEADIRAAHRRLMKKLHPDQGGSDFLARQINQAKDVLLNR